MSSAAPAATAEVAWNVLGDRVCGFGKCESERDHLTKHFLDPAEQWEDLRPETRPAEYQKRIDAGGEDPTVWEAAAREYVGLVRRHTTGQAIDRWAQGPYQPHDRNVTCEALWVVSQVGMFTAFVRSAGQLSVLVTSMRPLPKKRYGRLTNEQFRDQARWKLRNLLERTR